MSGRSPAAAAALLGALVARAAAAAPLSLPAAPGVRVQPFVAYGAARDGVVAMTAPASVAVPVTIPPGARLLTAVAVPDRLWTADLAATAAPLRFRVVFESENAAAVTLYERTIDIAARGADRRWFDFGRDLGALAGRRGTLRFETTLARPDAAPGTLALWASPEIAECADPAPAPSLLLVTLDALRADHLSSAGYARATTPYLDRLAATGARFTAAYAGGPKTIPSIPQILTGTYFFHHRATPGLGALLGARAGAVAPRFERSRAIVNNPYVASWLGGEHPGFDTVVAGELDARAITSAALRWLAATGHCRTALFLHYLDTHTPYHAPARYARRFVDRDAKTTIGLAFADVTAAWQGRFGATDRQRIVDLYDGSIAWTDRQLGRLLRGLARRGLAERTLVVVTADHGEELWDHGQFFHGQSLHTELLHVPLLVRMPGGAPGRVVDELVSSVDVLPTIVEAAGGGTGVARSGTDAARSGTDAAGDGTSLVPWLRGDPGAPPPHPVVFATVSNAEPRAPARQSVRSRAMAVVHDVEDGRYRVYDLVQDPREQHNLGPVAPGAVDLIAALDGFRRRLDGRGLQLRVRSLADHPVRYTVELRGDPPVPIVDPDRVALERDDYVRVGERSSAITLAGALAPGDADGIRMDVLATAGTLRAVMTVDGAPAPPGALRVGAEEKIAESVDLADPALVGAPAEAMRASATPAAAEGAAVVVSLWLASAPTTAAPAIDPAARERLRALGYVE